MPWPITFIPRGRGTEVRYAKDEAREAIAGYAFGTIGLGWEAHGLSRDSHLGSPPRAAERQAWAYRVFDCVQTNPERIEVADVAITAALDSQVGGTAILGVAAIKDDLNAVLTQI